jgi:hypothetical protein
MRRFTIIFALILGLSAVAVPCSHAAFDKDLGQGLRYFRTANMAADLGSLRQATRAPAVILDLRGASATAEALHEFDLTLGQATTPGLRIILLNAKTAPDVVRLVTTPRRRQITISPASAKLPTDLKVNIATERDLEAYVALETGTPLEKLVSSNPEKKRFDEAALARTHGNGPGSGGPGLVAANGAEEEDEGDPDNTPPTAPTQAPADAKVTTPPPLHDLVLERAVQLHRALDSKLGIKP